MKYNILIVGCGNIGMRYAQAIEKLNINLNLYLFDIDKLKIDKVVSEIKNKSKINIFPLFQKPLNQKFDLCILSTTSNVRLEICKDILKNNNVTKFIFEKVLCQSIQQLKNFLKLEKKFNFKSWISCHRSLWPDYIKLKKQINKNNRKSLFSLELKGYNWGLGCNSIHFIHLANFLFGDQNYNDSFFELKNINYWKNAKRKLYKEFNGSINIFFKNNSKILLQDNKKYKNQNFKIILKIENKKIIIDEIKNKIFFNKKKYKFKSETISGIFSKEIKKIIIFKKSNLPSLKETYDVHYYFIKNLLILWNKFKRKQSNKILPIT